ncbi:ubiquitin-specific protease 27 [Carex rostrata]
MKHERAIRIGSLIATLKNGFELLSQVRFTSSFVVHPVAACLGLGAGVASLYIALRGSATLPGASDREASSEIVHYVGGLDNLGNNCFLNVILQALASCSNFLPYLKSILESEHLLVIDKTEELPLIHALILLLEELGMVRDEMMVLSPKRVMAALSFYTSNFNLTRQQDAAEALLHLLTSLKSEILLGYVPHGSSVFSVTGFASRVYKKEMGYGLELEQWKKILFGPFDGTLRSMLTCLSCSSVLSMDYEHFDCLPLLPVLGKNGDITDTCSLVDCLKHFSTVELLENYRCDRCWHNSAIKYMSLKSETEEGKINKVRGCVNYDNCLCPNLFKKDEITWSGISVASKQLTLNHCPKILCIHLQRALMSVTGDFVKHEEHISFPFILDLSPFTKSTSTLQNDYALQKKPPIPNMQLVPHILKIMEGTTSAEEKGFRKFNLGGTSEKREEISQENQENSNSKDIYFGMKNCMYSLCAVVEHYGRYGGGHYAVYRKVPPVLDHGHFVEGSKRVNNSKWFYVSDRQVLEVSEAAVLSANATLLFYERI